MPSLRNGDLHQDGALSQAGTDPVPVRALSPDIPEQDRLYPHLSPRPPRHGGGWRSETTQTDCSPHNAEISAEDLL